MFSRFFLTISLFILLIDGRSQCLTDFTKLLPEPSTNYTQGFGQSLAIHDNILAVGAPSSDTLGRITGIVHLYKKSITGWNKIGVLKPSDPLPSLQFGATVDMTENYIVVGTNGYGGKVYIYRKPVTGWQTLTETTQITVANTRSFGSNLRFNGSIDLSEDEQTLAVVDQNYINGNNKYGALYIFHKSSATEWSNSLTPQVIVAPDADVLDFGTGGVAIKGSRIAIASPYANGGGGAIYIFKDMSGVFTSIQFEARLTPGIMNEAYFMGYNNFVFTDEGIFAQAVTTQQGAIKSRVVFFEQPAGIWSNSFPTCAINSIILSDVNTIPVRLSYDGSKLFCAYREPSGLGKLVVTKKNTTWCDATTEVIETFTTDPSDGINSFANYLVSDNNNVCAGLVALPDNSKVQLALKVFSHSNGIWTGNYIYNPLKSTAGHFYGSRVLGFGDFMFVSAPGDGTAKANAGAVYAYKKSGSTWTKTGKIIPTIVSNYDDVFGSGLASNGDQLAVGAYGFEPDGQVLIYKNKSADWSNVELAQRIIIPDSVYSTTVGQNMAMSKDWLVLSIARNPPSGSFRTNICIYKFNGSTWEYFQRVEVGFGNPFNKSYTPAVDIEGETIVAGNLIIERNAKGLWEPKYVFSNSDPEPMRISSDFTHWVTDGDLFGASVDITENAIFIGAPTKDHDGIWNVGAVYVFTRKPGYTWKSGTETAKILPRVKSESELFGYSVRGLNNTLIVGAPGGDYFWNTSIPRNKPGRAYIIQSKDFYWTDLVHLVDLTGDAFVKDYFGIEVNLDESDFFISATVEDNGMDNLAGSVYVTPTPPMVKLIPPICLSSGKVDLFGYPFGGTWSGVGITDATKGTFDPQLTGPGIFELTYKTESCAYEGKLKLEVKLPPTAEVIPDQGLLLCEVGTKQITLSIQPQTNCSYQWYLKAASNNTFSKLQDAIDYKYVTNKIGEYKVEVNNGYCSVFTPVMNVNFEGNPIDINPIPAVCDPSLTSITLSATPNQGFWTSPNLTLNKNTVNISNIQNGTYKVTYRLNSSIGCSFVKDADLIVNRISKPNYLKAGTVCNPNGAVLSVSPQQSNLLYSWTIKRTGTVGFLPLSDFKSLSDLSINENASYQLTVKNNQCTVTLDPFIVNDQFTAQITPTEKNNKTCSSIPFIISSMSEANDHFNWYYSADKGSTLKSFDFHESKMEIKETGLYQIEVTRGGCQFKSEPIFVEVSLPDTLYVPNVFTPNGDTFNEEFRITTSLDIVDLKIINRYGKEMFRGDGKIGWNGKDASPGIYYWQTTYKDCTGLIQKLKGYVQLIH